MASDVMVRMEGVWKRYGLGIRSALRRAGRALQNGDGSGLPADDGPWALRDIDLEVRKGEALGIIGRNGAGKSTLLKILAGVSPPTQGRVEIRGSVFPMIQLNAGLHIELTGRENVYLLGAIMGLSRADMRARMSQIEEFSDLGDYFDQPVRTYSSGMLARLGFSVAVSVDADILLVDEVLAVGDFAFQNKCQAHFRLKRRQQTLLYVTHNLISLPYICDRTLYLENGSIKAAGPSQEIVALYEREALLQEHRVDFLPEGVSRRDTSGCVEILAVSITDDKGQPVEEVESRQGFCLNVEGFCPVPVTSPLFGLSILDSRGNMCLWNFSAEDGYTFDRLQGRFRVTAQVPPLPLRDGRYNLNFTIRDGDGFINLERLHAPSLVVKGEERTHGILAAKIDWCLEQGEDTKQ